MSTTPRKRHRKQRPSHTYDWAEYDRLTAEGLSERAVAHRWNMPQRTLNNARKRRERESALDSAEPSADLPPVQSASISDIRVTTPAAEQCSPIDLQAIEARLSVVEAFVVTMQRQVRHSAVPSAVQTRNNPEDAKAERWNLWLPRGLKRRIDTQAKATGISPSRIVQRLLMAALNGSLQAEGES
jgi:hypothetical protein